MSERNEIQPALSPEEWAEAGQASPMRSYSTLDLAKMTGDGAWEAANDFLHGCRGDARHVLAAICLHGQPFGPNHAHLRALRAILGEFRVHRSVKWSDDGRADTQDNLRLAEELAGIIAALLPPEDV